MSLYTNPPDDAQPGVHDECRYEIHYLKEKNKQLEEKNKQIKKENGRYYDALFLIAKDNPETRVGNLAITTLADPAEQQANLEAYQRGEFNEINDIIAKLRR